MANSAWFAAAIVLILIVLIVSYSQHRAHKKGRGEHYEVIVWDERSN